MNQTPWIVVGLGNPGPTYIQHRHNIGFYALSCIQEQWNFPPIRHKTHFLYTEGRCAEQHVTLVWPNTFMNCSGSAVAGLWRHHKHASWLVIHDDLEIPCGIVKWKQGGGTGGHNGLKSLTTVIGPDYARLRIGIGRPLEKSHVSQYVLSPFLKEERTKVECAVDRALDILPLLFKGDNHQFVMQLHTVSR